MGRPGVIQITTNLEDQIRKRVEELRERLKAPRLDQHARGADHLHAQLATLQWVLEEAGLR